MIVVKITVKDTDQAEAIVNHIIVDGLLYAGLPLAIEVMTLEEDEEDG